MSECVLLSVPLPLSLSVCVCALFDCCLLRRLFVACLVSPASRKHSKTQLGFGFDSALALHYLHSIFGTQSATLPTVLGSSAE